MRQVALSISILVLLFAGTISGITTQSPSSPRAIRQAGISSNITRLGIDCGLGSTQAVVNATGFPVAPSENGSPELLTNCTWIGDAGQTLTGTSDGTTEPLVTDQDEALSQTSLAIGGGFTADIVILQNSTATIDGFDLQVKYNPAILHAVQIDQTGLEWKSQVLITAENRIDNTNGVAELAQVIGRNLFGGNATLFRIRFDVVGVGESPLTVADVTYGIVNPGPVVHSILNGAFDSESFFDPSHSLNWNANLILLSPLSPGSPNSFLVNTSCPGCTAPFSYQWQFNSTNATPFIKEATGNPITITIPSSTLVADRITVLINDSATPSPNTILLTTDLQLTATIQGPASSTVGSSNNWTGYWLGGNPSYTGRWRLCPGTATNKLVCSNPSSSFSQPGQLSTVSNLYNYAGVYQNTLTVTDTASPITSSSTQTASIPANVTGKPAAFNVFLNATGGPSFTFTASVAYNSTYPASFRSSQFSYYFIFGDGSTQQVTGSTTATVFHTYATNATFTPIVVARETGAQAPSQISETGRTSITTNSAHFDYQIQLYPFQSQISSGQSIRSQLYIYNVVGTPQTVHLSAVFSIPGATVSFAPALGTPYFTSNMTITTSTSTPSGKYSIIIQGNTTAGIAERASFILAVNVPLQEPPVFGVFSSHYGTGNITDTSLVAGSQFSVQVNITNTGLYGINAYDLALFYDQRIINVTSYNAITNTVLLDPTVFPETRNSPGALRLSVFSSDTVIVPAGMLVNITFTVIRPGVSPLYLAPGAFPLQSYAGAPPGICPSCTTDTPNWSVILTPNQVPAKTSDGYFNDVGGNPAPVASFTYSPSNPLSGQTITFNATSSFDPDNTNSFQHGIREYMWDFGERTPDGNQTTFSPIITHTFQQTLGGSQINFYGDFSVRLTVIDLDNGFEGMSTTTLTINPIHDVAVKSVRFSNQNVIQGGQLTVFVDLANLGPQSQYLGLTITYAPPNSLNQTIIETVTNLLLAPQSTYTVQFTLNTTGLKPGTYIVTATVPIASDNNPSNNTATASFQVTHRIPQKSH